ncbi:MAG TPA: chemotaxis response regulator protein-glutamate methylesterase [Xanthobacteraceae bacterium]|jgi:two-component system chemotaxis response regulator CheB|nr:chemotaxis response regulator protein-glutamate methylesterase [Xanthobacteraceae bacterium]
MSLAATIAPAASASGQAPIRVMVVDDAVVVRGLVSRWIDEEPGMQVVASLRTGRQAVDQLERTNPDVVILDVEMPDLDGLSALPLLLEKKRDLVVIMASTLTRRNAEVSLKALSYGAADYIPKPETNREVTTSASFRRDLIEKIRQLGGRRRRSADAARRPVAEPAARAAGIEPRTISDAAAVIGPIPIVHTSLRLRPFSTVTPRVLLIGSSTGGPQALTGIMPHLAPVIDRAPVLIIQHMPPTFTTILAEHLARASGRPAHEAVDGEPVVPGKIYIAPGGRHMRVIRRQPHPFIALDDGPPVNFCKPAVDPLFQSAVEIWNNAILSVILTGMGHDGTHGAADIVAHGGSVIAQDEATSVVWGMPGSAANAGVCSAVLPIDQIAPKVVRLFQGDRV